MKNGQGVVESVFAIGILALLLSGAVILVMLGSANRRSSFDRRKATELATIAIEDLVGRSMNSPEEFWQLNNEEGLRKSEYEGYVYSVEFSNITNNLDYPQCGIGKTDCAEAVISVGWSGKTDQNLYFNRFFSKQ